MCHDCGVEKKLTDYPNRFINDGKLVRYRRKLAFCSVCDSKKNSDSVHKNHVNYIKARVRDMKRRAFTRALSVSKEVDDSFFIDLFQKQKGLCCLSGLPMTWGSEGQHGNSGVRRGTNISIDRINPNLGYEVNNVRLVCDRANKLKSNMDDFDLYFWSSIISETMRKN